MLPRRNRAKQPLQFFVASIPTARTTRCRDSRTAESRTRAGCRIGRPPRPAAHGIIAPPTIAVMISPDPLLVIGPSPAMPSVKMLGNMMELKKPHSTSVQMATLPEVDMDDDQQRGSRESEDAQQLARLYLGQNPRTEQAAHQRAKPVERSQERCRLERAHALRLEVVHGDRCQSHFHAHIKEDPQRAQHRVPVAPDAACSPALALARRATMAAGQCGGKCENATARPSTSSAPAMAIYGARTVLAIAAGVANFVGSVRINAPATDGATLSRSS